MPKLIVLLLSLLLIAPPKPEIPDSKRAGDVRAKVWPKLQKELKDRGFKTHSSIYIREGFYTIEPKQLNPVSNYYLAINVGYPNKVEQLKGYTGDAIMVHGHCASIGCYAMTDARIEEIYTLIYEAFTTGQKQIRVDIFPFRMDNARMKLYSAYYPNQVYFWRTLKPGYDLFEKRQIPVEYHIKGNDYAF